MSPHTCGRETKDTMTHARYRFTITARDNRVDPPVDPPPAADDEAIKQAKFEADAAKAEAARIKRELEELKKHLPNDDQRARWAELEAMAAKAEEDRLKKSGEFDAWRQQINDTHSKALDAERQMRENASAQAKAIETDLQNTLIGQEFARTSDLFGPTGKTVLLPEVAQSYFARNVEVEVVPHPAGGAPSRRVVVRDHHGAIILDAKNGQPMSFGLAMAQLIDSHPQKAHLLRGSGKVGSNSTGGAHGTGDIDLSRLKASDFADPKVREAVKERQAAAGGLQIGPAFDRIKQGTRSK
jgi:hypothetical protein